MPLPLEHRDRHYAFLTSDEHDTHVHIGCFHYQDDVASLAVISRGDNTNEAPDRQHFGYAQSETSSALN